MTSGRITNCEQFLEQKEQRASSDAVKERGKNMNTEIEKVWNRKSRLLQPIIQSIINGKGMCRTQLEKAGDSLAATGEFLQPLHPNPE